MPRLLLLCVAAGVVLAGAGLGCGDRVVVARGLSLVSAAESSDDAGFGELDPDAERAERDAGHDAAGEHPFDLGHGGSGRLPPRPPPPSAAPPVLAPPQHVDGHGNAHDGENDNEDKPGKLDDTHDAGAVSSIKNH